jgi:hypothetical protein
MRKRLKQPYMNFEETFRSLLEKAKEGPVSVKTFLTILSGKGRVLLLIFISLGFSQIPGISVFLGFLISYLGLRIAMSRSFIWMPKALLHKKISSYLLLKVIKQILHFLKLMRHWSRPRYIWATHNPILHVITGFMIALVGLSIAISPPVPLIGLLSFVAIFLIAIGLLNNDGVYIFMGYIFTVVYFIAVIFLLKSFSLSKVVEMIHKIF